jgi:nonribosomal peptide synthetase protein VioO
MPGLTLERIPIGRALPHVREYVSEDGELVIGGPPVALGYKGLPEATKARFVEVDGEMRFSTGDRVSAGPHGVLFHEGRIDNEVKIRASASTRRGRSAHRGAPGRERGRGDRDGASRADRPGRVRRHARRNHVQRHPRFLRARVPQHLVPSRLSIVPQLVYTTSGKVDRAKSKESFNEH